MAVRLDFCYFLLFFVYVYVIEYLYLLFGVLSDHSCNLALLQKE